MSEVDDGFDGYYAERLWQLLPAAYRSADTASLDAPGPLRELIGRIGAQVATVRRSIDQLWADQSIETCADWVVPYIGDLLGANLVNQLAPAGQRLDVAKTIHYRRHKGTLQAIDELGSDVTGWGCVAVEAFRRLARTRHGLDPPVGRLAYPNLASSDLELLLRDQMLAGRLTGTPAGGYADLRSADGAALSGTAFDEYSHVADLRPGRGAVGHFGITKLLVFVWRLRSFAVVGSTPVPVAGSPGTFVFDPTGREIPLFLAPPARPTSATDFDEAWAAALEWQVPGPLSSLLEDALASTDPLAGPSAAPDADPGSAPFPIQYLVGGGGQVDSIAPERGRFTLASGSPSPGQVAYQYGFSATLGAGPYDRGLLGGDPAVVGAEARVSGGSGLDAALAAAGATGTVTLSDSLTYRELGSAGPVDALLVRAGVGERPVLRPAAGSPAWVFTGGDGAQLTLDGLMISGCDIVLRGPFASVRIRACTVDPGTAADDRPGYATAADGRALAPSRIFIESDPDAPEGSEGAIEQLLIDHSILGPIRTRYGGTVQSVSIADSIVQDVPGTATGDPFDPVVLARGLLAGRSAPGSPSAGFRPAAAILGLTEGLEPALDAYLTASPAEQRDGLPAVAGAALEAIVAGPSFHTRDRFATVVLSPEVLVLAAAPSREPAQTAELNRRLLAEAFPLGLADAALAVAGATISLTRVTVLGPIWAHRLRARDSIMGGFTVVEDAVDGCVRFSAYTLGGRLARTYESVAFTGGAGALTSGAFGDPGYGQLSESADSLIVGGDGPSISAGAENGSEMGAFSSELGPVKEQGLLTKYAEYMPLGLEPVIVHVT